jgi:hypothetical protein
VLPAGKNSRESFWNILNLFGKFRSLLESAPKSDCSYCATSTGVASDHAAECAREIAGMTEAESFVKLLDQMSIFQERKCVMQFLLIKPLLGRHVKRPQKIGA